MPQHWASIQVGDERNHHQTSQAWSRRSSQSIEQVYRWVTSPITIQQAEHEATGTWEQDKHDDQLISKIKEQKLKKEKNEWKKEFKPLFDRVIFYSLNQLVLRVATGSSEYYPTENGTLWSDKSQSVPPKKADASDALEAQLFFKFFLPSPSWQSCLTPPFHKSTPQSWHTTYQPPHFNFTSTHDININFKSCHIKFTSPQHPHIKFTSSHNIHIKFTSPHNIHIKFTSSHIKFTSSHNTRGWAAPPQCSICMGLCLNYCLLSHVLSSQETIRETFQLENLYSFSFQW